MSELLRDKEDFLYHKKKTGKQFLTSPFLNGRFGFNGNAKFKAIARRPQNFGVTNNQVLKT